MAKEVTIADTCDGYDCVSVEGLTSSVFPTSQTQKKVISRGQLI